MLDKRDISDKFHKRLSRLLDEKQLSLPQFAKDIGVDRSALSQFLDRDATRLPRAETLCHIANICGVSLDWLLGLVGDDDNLYHASGMMEFIDDDSIRNHDIITHWHKEALGYKIRYVPSGLPDLLRHDSVSHFEHYHTEQKHEISQESQSSNQLHYSRRPETDIECCLSYQELQNFAYGQGKWSGLNKNIRIKQLEYMRQLLSELYPTFRLFLFNKTRITSAPYTVFGPHKAVIYIGNAYLVIHSKSHIEHFIKHFDNLIRIADYDQRNIDDFLKDLIDTI